MSQQPRAPGAGVTLVPSKVGRTGTELVVGLEKSGMDQLPKPAESTNEGAKAGEQGAGTQGQKDLKFKQRKTSLKGRRKGKPGKIHIRLPPIEAYQKDLCFAAEAPGRVVVRLERLMGSDKIRPVDGKFMETLIQRLEEEEKIAWERKIRLRKKAEKERYRQLAISGLMEPGPGMEDLYNHPVFRVNRILNRLSSLDNTFSNNPALKLPPIVQIDPFETDETGAFFKEYPAHRALRKEWEKYKDKTLEGETIEEEVEVNEIKSEFSKSAPQSRPELASQLQSSASVPASSKSSTMPPLSKANMSTTSKGTVSASSKAPISASSPPSDIEEEDEYDEELLEEEDLKPPGESSISLEEEEELTEMEYLSNELNREYLESLSSLQKKYGVPNSPRFEDDWKPFRSELVDKFHSDFETADDMYDAARDLFDLYTRQAMVTQEHIKGPKGQSKSKGSSKKQLKISQAVLDNSTLQPTRSNVVAPSASVLDESMTDDEEEDEEMMSDNLATDKTVSNALVNDGEEKGDRGEDSEEIEPVPVLTDEEEVEE